MGDGWIPDSEYEALATSDEAILSRLHQYALPLQYCTPHEAPTPHHRVRRILRGGMRSGWLPHAASQTEPVYLASQTEKFPSFDFRYLPPAFDPILTTALLPVRGNPPFLSIPYRNCLSNINKLGIYKGVFREIIRFAMQLWPGCPLPTVVLRDCIPFHA